VDRHSDRSRRGAGTAQARRASTRPRPAAPSVTEDYMQTLAPFPNAALRDAEVTKMIKTFGAPIDKADAATIKNCLKKASIASRSDPNLLKVALQGRPLIG
jgi:hypothetical protein